MVCVVIYVFYVNDIVISFEFELFGVVEMARWIVIV